MESKLWDHRNYFLHKNPEFCTKRASLNKRTAFSANIINDPDSPSLLSPFSDFLIFPQWVTILLKTWFPILCIKRRKTSGCNNSSCFYWSFSHYCSAFVQHTCLSLVCAGDIWQTKNPLSPRMPSTPQNCSQQCTGAHATVCIREPADDTWLCLLFTAQDNTTDTQLSQSLAKISRWRSRSWPGLSSAGQRSGLQRERLQGALQERGHVLMDYQQNLCFGSFLPPYWYWALSQQHLWAALSSISDKAKGCVAPMWWPRLRDKCFPHFPAGFGIVAHLDLEPWHRTSRWHQGL